MADDAVTIPLITDLNNDCLRRILLFVPVADRIRLRRVCKRFCEISDDCWREVRRLLILDPTKNLVSGSELDDMRAYNKVLKFEKGLSGIHNLVNLKTSNQRLIEGILKRCGEFITTLRDYRDNPDDFALLVVTKYCRKLKILKINIASKVGDEKMNQLLAVNKKLKTLDLDTDFKNIKVCFRTVPTEFLEEFRIEFYGIEAPPSILNSQKQIVLEAHFLKRLDFNTLDDELIELIGEKRQLEVLNLKTAHADYLTRTGLNPIMYLKNLRKLDISSAKLKGSVHTNQPGRAPVYDDFLAALAENLQLLETLNLQAPANVTDKGFARLALLPKLTDLVITNGEKITDKFLILFDKIKFLCLIECNIRDEGVIKFIEKSQTVRRLNLAHSHITNKSLIAAVQATKKRQNGNHLLFVVTHTNAAPEELADKSPLLTIVNRKMDNTANYLLL